jgi:hypothetical protein
MAGFIILGMIAAFSAIGIAASLWGVDSRDGFSDPNGPTFPVGLR